MTVEEFYFQKIAPAHASPEDYRQLFDLLWRTHGEAVFKHAYSRLGNREDARDVCQDVFVQAMKYIQKDPRRVPLKVNFRAWLRVIARNLIYDRFRRVLVQTSRASMTQLETVPAQAPPEKRMITAEDLAILRWCLEALTERARSILTMCDVEGMAEKEAGEKLNMQPNAVYVALHRARKSVRDCVTMKQHLGEA